MNAIYNDSESERATRDDARDLLLARASRSRRDVEGQDGGAAPDPALVLLLSVP
eukprot:COSAG02_NODE_19135_length_897_cov_157.125313_2_plen_54_part_00